MNFTIALQILRAFEEKLLHSFCNETVRGASKSYVG